MKSEVYAEQLFPAPWQLTGRGYVFPYRLDREFALAATHIPVGLKPSFKGGFGALMLVDYSSSNCGPYHELLFIPGSFAVDGRTLPSISRIFVSSMTSVVNGQRNWGIPKDQADFKVEKAPDGTEIWQVRFRGKEIFSARLQKGIVPLPVHSALIPHTLMQIWDHKRFYTRLSARGIGRRAKILEIKGDGAHFPDLSQQKTFLGLGMSLDSFHMTFHEAIIQPEGASP